MTKRDDKNMKCEYRKNGISSNSSSFDKEGSGELEKILKTLGKSPIQSPKKKNGQFAFVRKNGTTA